MNENFRQIKTLLLGTRPSQTHAAFLSIRFDPAHDTPAVMKHYPSIYDKQPKRQRSFHWQFVVPAAKDLPEVANFLGLVTQSENGQMVHSPSTALIGPDGKDQNWHDRNDWKPSEVSQVMLQLFA
jgi:protein SCO1/2